MQVLKYIKGTLQYDITYTKGSTLTRFYNPDCTRDMDSKTSMKKKPNKMCEQDHI